MKTTTVLCALLALPIATAWPETSAAVEARYVDCDTGDDANDGLSWDAPLRTLQAALPLASEVNARGDCTAETLFLDRVVLRGSPEVRIDLADDDYYGELGVGPGGAGLYNVDLWPAGITAIGPVVVEHCGAGYMEARDSAIVRNSSFFPFYPSDQFSWFTAGRWTEITDSSFYNGATIGCDGTCGPVRVERSVFGERPLRLHATRHMNVVLRDISTYLDPWEAVCITPDTTGKITFSGGERPIAATCP